MRVGLRRQVLVLAVALALWSVSARPELAWLLAAYALAALVLGVVRAQEWAARPWRAFDAVLLVALAAPGGVALFRSGEDLLADAGLDGIATRVTDRIRLEALPSIVPPLVSADQPQAFYVRAAPAARVRVRFGAHGKELVAYELGHGLYRVDYEPRRDGLPSPADGTLTATIAVNGAAAKRALLAATPLAHPRWFALSPDRRLAATVSEETDELVIVSARGLERRIPVGDGPTDCAFVGDDAVAVTHRHDRALLIIEAASGAKAGSLELGSGQVRLATSPDRAQLAIARSGRAPELVLVDVPARRVRARLALEHDPDWIAFGADAEQLVYSSRSDARLVRVRIEPDGRMHEDAELALGRAAVTLARSGDGAQMIVAVTDYRPDEGANLGNHFVQDQLLTLDVARFAIVRAEPTARRSPRQSKPGDVDRGLSPLGAALAADGSRLIAFAGSDELWRVRDGVPEPEIIDLGDHGLAAPHGVAELADGTLVVSSPSAGAIALFAPGQAKPTLFRLAPDDAYLRAHNRAALERRLGERGFYEATRSGISCQSCHTHADSDASAHNLGTHRALPTASVRGVLGTAPYLRDGSFARIEDLDHVAQTLYRGYLRRVPERAHTLAAYVAALPRRQPAREERPLRNGVNAFVRAECPTCHALPAFTNLGQHSARALFPDRAQSGDDLLDTPSLLSLAASAPYLSDGRARTLAAVLEQHNRENRHGDVARLSAGERRELIAFLESL